MGCAHPKVRTRSSAEAGVPEDLPDARLGPSGESAACICRRQHPLAGNIHSHSGQIPGQNCGRDSFVRNAWLASTLFLVSAPLGGEARAVLPSWPSLTTAGRSLAPAERARRAPLACRRVGLRNVRTRSALSVHAASKLCTTSSDLRLDSDGLRPEGEARGRTLGNTIGHVVFSGGVAQVREPRCAGQDHTPVTVSGDPEYHHLSQGPN